MRGLSAFIDLRYFWTASNRWTYWCTKIWTFICADTFLCSLQHKI